MVLLQRKSVGVETAFDTILSCKLILQHSDRICYEASYFVKYLGLKFFVRRI